MWLSLERYGHLETFRDILRYIDQCRHAQGYVGTCMYIYIYIFFFVRLHCTGEYGDAES